MHYPGLMTQDKITKVTQQQIFQEHSTMADGGLVVIDVAILG